MLKLNWSFHYFIPLFINKKQETRNLYSNNKIETTIWHANGL